MKLPRLSLLLLVTLSTGAFIQSHAAEPPRVDVWIFSGQSNMGKIGGAAQRAVGEVVERHGRGYETIYVANPGTPIEAWLEPDHKAHRLWQSIVEQIAAAKRAGKHFAGFVWYQGESNVGEASGRYQQQLAELVGRVRNETGEPELPAIIVQIGAATSYDGRDWAVGTVREAQRRFARDDGHSAVVTAIDAEIGDYTVHLSSAGSQLVAARIAAAADRLAYGNAAAHWGPQFASATFADDARRHVIVRFDDVKASLRLADGWLAGFGASVKTKLPDQLGELADTKSLGALVDDFIYPEAGQALGDDAVVLQFAEPLPADACISYAPMRNAQYGPHRRWRLEFAGLADTSGQQAPAFTLAPIAASKSPVEVPTLKPSAAVHDQWRQIAVNCVGRFPAAITAAETKAGVDADGWRQPYWNPASAGESPNLIDSQGHVTPVGFRTGVWYMNPYFAQLDDADDALMASWCRNSTHGFVGLLPGKKYDLAVYLLQGPLKNSDEPPTHRAVKVSVLQIPAGKNRKHASVVREQVVQVPASGAFEGYEVADSGSELEAPRGNVLLLSGIAADDQGRIDLAVEVGEPKGDKIKWGDTTLAGVQIRAAE